MVSITRGVVTPRGASRFPLGFGVGNEGTRAGLAFRNISGGARIGIVCIMSVLSIGFRRYGRGFYIPLDRELSLPAELKPNVPMGLVFQMLFPQGEARDERSLSLALSEIPLEKSRDRVCGGLSIYL